MNDRASVSQMAPLDGPLYRAYCLVILSLIYVSNVADRFVISTLIEPIKSELKLSDSAIGFLTGTALALFYTGAGIPLGMIADRVNRRNLIAWSITIWSVMTAACGLAITYVQLLGARVGVGIGEAGATPASQSMLADLFPVSRRAVVMSVFALGAAAGSMVGSVAGGWLSDSYGWRSAFVVLAIPGVVLALVLRLTVGEPVRGRFERVSDQARAPSLPETIAFIRTQPALFHVLVGAAVVTFWGWGLLWWTPAFLGRSYGMGTGEAGAAMGLLNGIAGTAGILAGALLTHRLSRTARHQAWIVAMATCAGTAFSAAAYLSTTRTASQAWLWLFVPTVFLNIGPTFAMIQSLSLPRMRGVVCGLMLFGANIANLALAPQLIGGLSDVLHSHGGLGVESLRYALVVTTCSGWWAAFHFWKAGRAAGVDEPCGPRSGWIAPSP